MMLGPVAGERLAAQCATLLGTFEHIRLDDGPALGGQMSGVALAAALLVGSVALPAAACSIGCVLLQTQFYVGGAPIRFQASRISPMAGMARLFSSRHLLDFLKSCGRLAVLGLLVWSVLAHGAPGVVAAIGWDVAGLLPDAGERIQALGRSVLVLLTAFAVADVFLVRFQHTRSMRMTREQVRREMREADGDPAIKAKLQRIRQQRAKRRMMSKVKSADVIITNPTHYAIALAYERGGVGAPRVVAKGVDFIAARIREEAAAHGVPVVPNPPLARALYLVELDQEIPTDHYKAVAEVIAFVWKLRARAAPAVRAPS
jgi:flagellar biosynthetic protein FlhB